MTGQEELIRWDWIADHLDEIPKWLIQHLQLTILAVVIGFVISFPIAVYAYRHRRVYPPATWVTGLLYTIPSLALFAVLDQPLRDLVEVVGDPIPPDQLLLADHAGVTSRWPLTR